MARHVLAFFAVVASTRPSLVASFLVDPRTVPRHGAVLAAALARFVRVARAVVRVVARLAALRRGAIRRPVGNRVVFPCAFGVELRVPSRLAAAPLVAFTRLGGTLVILVVVCVGPGRSAARAGRPERAEATWGRTGELGVAARATGARVGPATLATGRTTGPGTGLIGPGPPPLTDIRAL